MYIGQQSSRSLTNDRDVLGTWGRLCKPALGAHTPTCLHQRIHLHTPTCLKHVLYNRNTVNCSIPIPQPSARAKPHARQKTSQTPITFRDLSIRDQMEFIPSVRLQVRHKTSWTHGSQPIFGCTAETTNKRTDTICTALFSSLSFAVQALFCPLLYLAHKLQSKTKTWLANDSR